METIRQKLLEVFPPETIISGRIWLILVEKALGPDNALTAEQLGVLSGVEDDRWQTVTRGTLRRLVRTTGLPIVGGSRGYYVATSPQQLRERADSLRRRAREVERRAEALDQTADQLQEALAN